jgi:hypothetical protein
LHFIGERLRIRRREVQSFAVVQRAVNIYLIAIGIAD